MSIIGHIIVSFRAFLTALLLYAFMSSLERKLVRKYYSGQLHLTNPLSASYLSDRGVTFVTDDANTVQFYSRGVRLYAVDNNKRQWVDVRWTFAKWANALIYVANAQERKVSRKLRNSSQKQFHDELFPLSKSISKN